MAAGALHITFPSCAASSVLCLVNVGATILGYSAIWFFTTRWSFSHLRCPDAAEYSAKRYKIVSCNFWRRRWSSATPKLTRGRSH